VWLQPIPLYHHYQTSRNIYDESTRVLYAFIRTPSV
jgi:hypothetical protein